MTKNKHYINWRQYVKDPMEIERMLVSRITETGKEQIKKRRKASLSSFYAKEGKLIEVLPTNVETVGQSVRFKWLVLERRKRIISFK
jgi:hypothetical protein